MKNGLLWAVVFAVVAFSGAAQATTLSYTLAGAISGTDVLGLFGGGNLNGPATLSFNYDTDSMGKNGFPLSFGPGYEFYVDNVNDDAVTESLAIGNSTFAISSSNAPYPSTQQSLENCPQATCGFSVFAPEVDSSNSDVSQYTQMIFRFEGTTDIPLGQLLNADAVQSFLNSVNYVAVTIETQNGQGYGQDYLGLADVTITSASESPEPSSFSLLAVGVLVVLLRFSFRLI